MGQAGRGNPFGAALLGRRLEHATPARYWIVCWGSSLAKDRSACASIAPARGHRRTLECGRSSSSTSGPTTLASGVGSSSTAGRRWQCAPASLRSNGLLPPSASISAHSESGSPLAVSSLKALPRVETTRPELGHEKRAAFEPTNTRRSPCPRRPTRASVARPRIMLRSHEHDCSVLVF